MADAKPLGGKHALVTGGGSGIRFAIAKRFATLGEAAINGQAISVSGGEVTVG
jgi:NAD(P)-dependent dehydrogenase (short-subunit alcohol dehydrogenase family)